MQGIEYESVMELLGTEVRLLIGRPVDARLPRAEVAAVSAEAFLRNYHRRLSRFLPESELCSFNADHSAGSKVSPLLALAIRAGIWAAVETDGLVDPTLVSEIVSAGYAESRVGVAPASLADALAAAPARCPARPRADASWRDIDVDPTTGVVTRPVGLQIDTGGTGKGLAVDLIAGRLGDYEIFAIDAGGDLRIGGAAPRARQVAIEHPLNGHPAARFELSEGAVATSGLDTRIWRQHGEYAHHLLDPSTGRPAWTGVIQATALAPTALAAETFAKAALLSGPDHGPTWLEQHGGLLVTDDGSVHTIGPLPHLAEAEPEPVVPA